MPVLKTVVEETTKKRFRAMAKSRELSEAELLRAVVLAVTGEDRASDEPVKADAENSHDDRMTVWMPAFLKSAIKDRARVKGMAPSRWVAALVQSNLMREPVMTKDEVIALNESARELAAIGRNINQIARALNEAFHQTERVKLERLAELLDEIKANRVAIRNLVRASQQSWEAQDDID